MRRQSSLLNKALEGQVVSFKLYQAQQEQEQDILMEKVMKSKKKRSNSDDAAEENNEDKEEYDINDNSNLFFQASKEVDNQEEKFEKLKQLNQKIDQQHFQKKELSKLSPSKKFGRLGYDADPFSIQSPLTAGHNPLNKKFGTGKKFQNPISYNYDQSISEESEDPESDSESDQQVKQRNFKTKQFKTQDFSGPAEQQIKYLQKMDSYKNFKSRSKMEVLPPSSQNLQTAPTSSNSTFLSLSSNAETTQKIEKKQNFVSPLKLNKIVRQDIKQDQKSVITTQLAKDETKNDKNILQTPQQGLSTQVDKQTAQIYDSPIAWQSQKSVEIKGSDYSIKISAVMDNQTSENNILGKSNSQSMQQMADNVITKSKKLKTNLMDQVTQKKLEIHRNQKSLKQKQNAQGQRKNQFLSSSDFSKLKKQQISNAQVDQPESQKIPSASDREKSPQVTENEKTSEKLEKVQSLQLIEEQKKHQEFEKEAGNGEMYQFSFQTQMISAQSKLRERIKPLSVNTKPQPSINLPSIKHEKVQLIEKENIPQNKIRLSPILSSSTLVNSKSQKIIDIQQGENGAKYQIKEIITDTKKIDEQNNQEGKKEKQLISKDVNWFNYNNKELDKKLSIIYEETYSTQGKLKAQTKLNQQNEVDTPPTPLRISPKRKKEQKNDKKQKQLEQILDQKLNEVQDQPTPYGINLPTISKRRSDYLCGDPITPMPQFKKQNAQVRASLEAGSLKSGITKFQSNNKTIKEEECISACVLPNKKKQSQIQGKNQNNANDYLTFAEKILPQKKKGCFYSHELYSDKHKINLVQLHKNADVDEEF